MITHGQLIRLKSVFGPELSKQMTLCHNKTNYYYDVDDQPEEREAIIRGD